MATDKEIVESIRSQFDESFTLALPHLQRLELWQAAYECQIPENWDTYSQIYLPHFRTAVEQALPDAYNYLLPKTGMLSIQPGENMTYTQVAKVRDYYEQLVQHKIGLKKNGLLTLKDCMKLNIGYGEVTTEMTTPLDAVSNTIFGGGEVRTVRRMELGQTREVIKYNYVDWRTVIPTPDGATPEAVSCVYQLKGVREDVFRDMYREDAKLEQPVLKGDPEQIIKDVRSGYTSLAHFPIWWVMGQFGTTDNMVKSMRQLNDMNLRQQQAQHSPVKIPILVCEFEREHIWITPDGTVIYHIKDTIQTFRKSVVKATANPDGENWFPIGDAGSSFDATEGANILQNAVIDLMSYKLHPATVINRAMVTDADAVVEPYAQLDAYGKVGDAVATVNGPQIDQSMFNVGAQLDQQISKANGQPQNLEGSGTAGVMRGGGAGFESLLATTRARAKLASAVLQTGWLEDVVNNVIILSQVTGQDDKYIFEDGLTKEFVEKTITAQDMRHSFTATLDLDDKFHKTASDRAMDLQMYDQVWKGNPKFDQDAVSAEICVSRDQYRRLKATPELEEKQRQALQEQQAQQEAAKAEAQAQAQGGGVNPGKQAVQGGQKGAARR